MSGKQNSSFRAISIPSGDSVGFGEPCLAAPDIPLAGFSVSALAGSGPGLVWGDGCSRCGVITLPALAPLGICFPPFSSDGRREERGMNFFHGKSEEQEADC